MLVSGRFSMLDDSLGFRLVSWKPVIEQWLGQAIDGDVERRRRAMGVWAAAWAVRQLMENSGISRRLYFAELTRGGFKHRAQ
ncbi:MAG: DUF3363 domain-containing protein [Polaromonas sp.]